MNNSPNNPDINGKYNYVYKITNLINKKEYIGVHRTNNIEDGYMGSGTYIKRSVKKYGLTNFKKEIIAFFNTYKEALELEKQLVTEEYINSINTYNIKEGGYGNAKWSKEFLKTLSKSAKKRWENPEYRQKMIESFNTLKSKKNRSKGIKNWIKNNPIRHKEKMLKINKNTEKIKKTASKHRGAKRSLQACKNVSIGLLKKIQTDPNYALAASGKGKRYIYNPLTKETKRVEKESLLPKGWVPGSGPKKNLNSYKEMNKGSVFAHHPITLQIKRYKSKVQIPLDWIVGRTKK
jgi:hypothetical protein